MTRFSKTFLTVSLLAFSVLLSPLVAYGVTAGEPAPQSPDAHFKLGELVASDDFTQGLDQWRVEAEAGGAVQVREGTLEIDVPAGCTVWFVKPFEGPVLITYEATVVGQGGPNDRVSDLNCFWMATDSRSPGDLFGTPRSGKFAEYDELLCYYVGLGGNANTSSRMRRYVGEKGYRPLLIEHDLSAKEDLLLPNVSQTLSLLSSGTHIAFYRDSRCLFTMTDAQPYTRGHFGLRTVTSHLRIKHFRVYRLLGTH